LRGQYNYFRDYDPAIGRYVQSDPIGLAGGINTYGYVLGNPLLYFDSDGLVSCQGQWKVAMMTFDKMSVTPAMTCTCFWLCMPCGGPVAFGDGLGLPKSRGTGFFNPNQNQSNHTLNRGKGPPGMRGGRGGGDLGNSNDCLCKPPGSETGCLSCPAPRD
jgi:uncharacterized protein RhaS with RHS repeats